tara:strand:+ start:2216 stop:2944 length:729 start_codon:yes stop_codon:yes gene_type:complete
MQNQYSTKYTGLQELLNTEESMSNYNSHIVNLFLNEMQIKVDSIILDFGAGIGTLAKIIEKKTSITPICLDIDSVNKTYLKKRGYKFIDSLEYVKNEYDIVFSSNVLEHIENDQKILKLISKALKDKGKLFLYLPAFQALFSGMDHSVGHYRRYEKKELINKCLKAGFKINKIYYDDSIGYFASLMLKIITRNKNMSHETLLNTKTLKLYDKFILPISLFIDFLGFKKLFGKNIVVVCEKIN